jgi:hypothetical protein
MDANQIEADMALVKKHVDELGEHWDTVQIFCSRLDLEQDPTTVNINLGSGNWFARYGQVREYLIRV